MRGKRKKNVITCICLSLLIVLLVVGCGKSTEIQEASGNSEKSSQTKETENNKDTTASAVIIQQDADEDQLKSKGNKADAQTNSEQEVASVIVKSDNNLSDSEKKEIVDQLSREVDELLTEINTEE